MKSAIFWLATGLLLLAVPGPTNALLAAAGAASGRRGAVTLIVAELLGYGAAIMVLTSAGTLAVGLHPLLAASLRLACGIYVAWIALTLWRGGAAAARRRAIGPRQLFLTTLLNPKAALFAFVILPGLPASSVLARVGFIMLLAFGAAAIAAGWIGFGASARRAPGVTPLVLNRAASLVLAGFATILIGSTIFGHGLPAKAPVRVVTRIPAPGS